MSKTLPAYNLGEWPQFKNEVYWALSVKSSTKQASECSKAAPSLQTLPLLQCSGVRAPYMIVLTLFTTEPVFPLIHSNWLTNLKYDLRYQLIYWKKYIIGNGTLVCDRIIILSTRILQDSFALWRMIFGCLLLEYKKMNGFTCGLRP